MKPSVKELCKGKTKAEIRELAIEEILPFVQNREEAAYAFDKPQDSLELLIGLIGLSQAIMRPYNIVRDYYYTS